MLDSSKDIESNAVAEDNSRKKLPATIAKTELYYTNKKNSDPRVIVAMIIGHSNFQRNNHEPWPDFVKGIWKAYSKWYGTFSLNADCLRNEVTRRAEAYFIDQTTAPMPKAWTRTRAMEWLMGNPIPIHLQEHELAFVDKQVEKLQEFVLAENEKANISKKDVLSNWSSCNPLSWFRFYHAIVDDDVKDSLARDMSSKNRAKLDGCKAMRGCTFYQLLANKFNDTKWVPQSIIMPDVHPDFSEAKLLPLAAKPITADEAKKRYVTSRSTLHVIHKNWLSSGSGQSMLSGTAEANNVYKFVDKDDRQDFLGGNASHILYFWQIGWQHQVLNTITQTLCYAATADGTRVARVASSPDTKKQKRLTTSNSSNNNTSILSSEMKSKFDQSFLHVNKVTTIQALLKSKQRELAQVSDQLGRFVESKFHTS